jgi:hypothetical protein
MNIIMHIIKYITYSPLLVNKITPIFFAITTLCIVATTFNIKEVKAGAFVYAGDANGLDLITHPSNYTGTGGEVDIKVCIDPGSINASEMERPIRNAIASWNKLQPTTSNLRDHLPGGNSFIGFESVFLHELGHCVGLAHPNIATESGKTGNDQNYTQSTKGDDYEFDLNAGDDSIIGSADDVRGDDSNLHWFRKDNNNPFSIAKVIDISTYARDQSILPNGDLFAVNGDRKVANQYQAPNSEAVMQQGTFVGEVQRTLLHDDVATLKLAMSGLDGRTSTSDDYTLNLTYGGVSKNCDINVGFDDTQTGLAVCKSRGQTLSGSHVRLTQPNIYFNSSHKWRFNSAPQCSQGIHLIAGKWRMISMPCQLGISTPNSVEAVFGNDLAIADYGSRWVLYEYLPASGYRKLELTDTLEEGRGYWIMSLDNKAIIVLGEYNSNTDFPLGDGSANEKWNLIGTPFRFDTTWADVQIIDTDGKVLTLNEASPNTIASTGFRWNSEAQSYDQLTPNSGALSPFDGAWVYSKKAGTALRVPMSNEERTSQ